MGEHLSIELGGPIELFLVPAGASQVLSCLWDGAYEIFLATDW